LILSAAHPVLFIELEELVAQCILKHLFNLFPSQQVANFDPLSIGFLFDKAAVPLARTALTISITILD
jgi:hypothetical protein